MLKGQTNLIAIEISNEQKNNNDRNYSISGFAFRVLGVCVFLLS